MCQALEVAARKCQLSAFVALQHSEDTIEWPKAFAEKRKPNWKGHRARLTWSRGSTRNRPSLEDRHRGSCRNDPRELETSLSSNAPNSASVRALGVSEHSHHLHVDEIGRWHGRVRGHVSSISSPISSTASGPCRAALRSMSRRPHPSSRAGRG